MLRCTSRSGSGPETPRTPYSSWLATARSDSAVPIDRCRGRTTPHSQPASGAPLPSRLHAATPSPGRPVGLRVKGEIIPGGVIGGPPNTQAGTGSWCAICDPGAGTAEWRRDRTGVINSSTSATWCPPVQAGFPYSSPPSFHPFRSPGRYRSWHAGRTGENVYPFDRATRFRAGRSSIVRGGTAAVWPRGDAR
jgi:hypothetical protein